MSINKKSVHTCIVRTPMKNKVVHPTHVVVGRELICIITNSAIKIIIIVLKSYNFFDFFLLILYGLLPIHS